MYVSSSCSSSLPSSPRIPLTYLFDYAPPVPLTYHLLPPLHMLIICTWLKYVIGLLSSLDMLPLPLEFVVAIARAFYLCVEDFLFVLKISGNERHLRMLKMRLLRRNNSVVTCTEDAHDSKLVRVYGLTPIAKYFITNEDAVSLSTFMELLTDKILINTRLGLTNSVMKGGVSFDKIYEACSYEYLALDARFNAVFNKTTVDHTTIVMKEVLERYHGFKNIKNMVDVGGITHVGGDTYDCVSQGDVIFMKWLIGNVGVNQGSKLLKNCYNALPDDGKVILTEAILPFLSDTSSATKVTTKWI
ncbi:caffeic acid 3-O-methyltransferase-like protein [Tanacetum coccineum]|uniref:Caffeic acid 3-O-methyltransferase-like protein n=1 Tax=Tanacetum coccineum TaxID=301880 RepID=A0ABQ4WBZ3_9ASTR